MNFKNSYVDADLDAYNYVFSDQCKEMNVIDIYN